MKSVRIRLRISPYSVRMRENMGQRKSEYGHFSCSGYVTLYLITLELITVGLGYLKNENGTNIT